MTAREKLDGDRSSSGTGSMKIEMERFRPRRDGIGGIKGKKT